MKPEIFIIGIIYLVLAMLVLLMSLGNLSGFFEALFGGFNHYCSRSDSSDSLMIANFLTFPMYILKLLLVFFARNKVKNGIKDYLNFSYASKVVTYFNRAKWTLIFFYPISLLLGLILPCAFIAY